MFTPIQNFLLLCIISLYFLTFVIATDYGDIKFHFGDRSSFVPSEPVAFPNIGHTGRGYDLLYANPDSTFGSDPGFRLSIFDLTSNVNTSNITISGDQRFIIPGGMSVYQDVSCNLESQTQVISSMKSYSASLQVSMSASVDFEGSFSMSADFQYAKSRMSNSRFAKATGTCMLYAVELHQSLLPALDPYFVQEVTRVANNKTITAAGISDIIRQFGTHYIAKARMGSRFGQQSEISAKYFQSQTSISIQASATASFDVASASLSTSASYDQASSFSSNCTSQSLYTVGALPPTDGSVDTWASQSIVSPEIISIEELSLLSTLFTTTYFPHISSAILSNLSKQFSNFTDFYCELTEGATCSLSEETKTDSCFGGWYTPQLTPPYSSPIINPFTGAMNCPFGYSPQGLYLSVESGLYDLVYCVSNNPSACSLGAGGTGTTSFGGMFVWGPDVKGCIQGPNPYPNSENCICRSGTNPIVLFTTKTSVVAVCTYNQTKGGEGFGFGGGFSTGIGQANTWGDVDSYSCEQFYVPYLFAQIPGSPATNAYICLRSDNPGFAAFNLPSPTNLPI